MRKRWTLYPCTAIALLMILLGCEDRPADDLDVCLASLEAFEKAQDHTAVVDKATTCLCIPGIDSSWVIEMRSFAHFRQGDFAAALKDDFRITQLSNARCSKKTAAWEEIGYLLEEKFKNHPMALWAYDQGIQCGNDCDSPYHANFNRIHKGQLLSKLKRYPEAVDAFESILATGDTAKIWLAKVNLMHIHLQSGSPSKCIALGYDVSRIQPLGEFQNYWMASAFDHLGQRDSACHYYHRAAEMGHPKSIDLAAQCPGRK